MARTIDAPANRASSPSDAENMDPVLVKLAETATFDCDWPTLRHHMYLALLASLPLFIEKGPPATYSGLIMIEPAPSPTSGSASASASGSGDGMWSGRDMPPHATGGLPLSRHDNPELRPSTMGGLIIPPFPPLDPERRRRPAGSPRLNGGGGSGGPGGPGQGRGNMNMNPFEDEWDDEVIIGGRKLPGWLDDDEGKKEVDRVARQLEDMSFAPFTVQRLAELLIAPTRLHSTLGKFLRAIEKMINVTTAYAAPSYMYVPPPPLPMHDSMGGSPALSAASPGSVRTDIHSTVPPGSMTPLFSPIPFLASGDMDALGEPMMEGGGGEDRGGEDGLMSPLMLESDGAFERQQQQQRQDRRSPTPEPEDDAMLDRDAEGAGEGGPETMDTDEPDNEEEGDKGAAADRKDDKDDKDKDAAASSSSSSASTTNGNASSPAHQSYLGQVDELDAGPITNGGTSAASASGAAAGTNGADSAGSGGVGEHGDMAPHGMRDRPVPISSTTVIADIHEREIAPLRRSASRAGGEPESDGEVEMRDEKDEKAEKEKEDGGEKGAGEGEGETKEDNGEGEEKEKGKEEKKEGEKKTGAEAEEAEEAEAKAEVKTEVKADDEKIEIDEPATAPAATTETEARADADAAKEDK